jgi:parallel beta-helix repeat protein
MKKTVLAILVVSILVTAGIPNLYAASVDFRGDKENIPCNITVPDDYPTIQQAVDHAKSGNVVYVNPGVYYETVVLNKSLTLKGIDYPTIDANREGSAILINAPNCTVDGFKVTNSFGEAGAAGVRTKTYVADNSTIKNNISFNNSVGIYNSKTVNTSIINNTVFGNIWSGISCWVAVGGCIADNIVYSNGDGIVLSTVGNVSVMNNTVYLHKETGIYLECVDSYIKGNRVFSNEVGIDFASSWHCSFIVENVITGNGWGFKWYSQIGSNYIYHNTIDSNAIQAAWYDKEANQILQNFWDDGPPSGGNYWSDYNGEDANNDGIGDSPYVIGANNEDHYPLMVPFTPVPAPTPSPSSAPSQSYFSVESNSTVTELFFNSTSAELSFNVTGLSGTAGYVEITIAKSLVSSIQDVKVYLDGSQLSVAITEEGDAWLLKFTYMHSTHQVMVSLVADSDPPTVGVESWVWVSSTIVIGVLLAVAVSFLYRRRLFQSTSLAEQNQLVNQGGSN